MKINVLDYPDVESALDAADDGDAIYFPGIREYTPKSGAWQITRSVHLYGDGAGTPGQAGGTVLKPFNANTPLFTIKAPVTHVHISDMELRGPGGTGSGVGILCQSSVTNQTQALGLAFHRLVISEFPSHGIQLDGYNDTTARIAGVSIGDCLIKGCSGAGILLHNAFDCYLAGCVLEANQQNGVSATDSGAALFQCVFDGNALLSSWSRATNPNEGNLKLDSCVVARVDACQFLNVQAGNVQRACVIVDSGGAILGACYFAATAATGADRQGVVVRGTEGPVVVLSNRYKDIEKIVVVESGVKDCMVFPQGEITNVGSMSLPQPNQGMFGGAQIQQGSGNQLTGMIIPSGPNDPAASESREGMLFYNTTGQALRAYLDGQWRTIEAQ